MLRNWKSGADFRDANVHSVLPRTFRHFVKEIAKEGSTIPKQ
jgi:hypothetical protein